LLNFIITIENGSNDFKIILGHNVDYTTAYSRSELPHDYKITMLHRNLPTDDDQIDYL